MAFHLISPDDAHPFLFEAFQIFVADGVHDRFSGINVVDVGYCGGIAIVVNQDITGADIERIVSIYKSHIQFTVSVNINTYSLVTVNLTIAYTFGFGYVGLRVRRFTMRYLWLVGDIVLCLFLPLGFILPGISISMMCLSGIGSIHDTCTCRSSGHSGGTYGSRLLP